MAITPQDVADQLNANGIDTPEAFGEFIAFAASLSRRNALGYQVQKLMAERQAAIQAKDNQIAQLNAQIADLDKTLSGA